MNDCIPFILKEEESSVHKSYGTSRLGEALAIIVRFLNEWKIEQRLIWMQMLSKSLCGEEIARELINVLSTTYGIKSKYILGAMRDRASTNTVAMQTLKIIYPSVVDIGCFSHTIDHVGERFKTPTLTDFVSLWITLFSHSPKTKLLWKTLTGRSMGTYSSTR